MKIKNIFNKLLTFILPIAGGILGAMGGAGNKSLRRIYIPLLLTGLAYAEFEHIAVLSIMIMCAWLSMGYGIPEPDGSDVGSLLGRFYYKLFNQNHKLADIFTRGTIGLLITFSLISIPIINHNWLVYGLGSLGIILTQSLISWRGFGTFKLFGKELSW